MNLREKYKSVLSFIEENAEPERIWEEDGKLKVRAIVETTEEREVIEGKIEAMGVDTPADFSLYLRVRESGPGRQYFTDQSRPPVSVEESR